MIGGVRGDVVALGYMQTTVMEMGQPPGEQGDDPSMWVHGRQYTGRIVRVTNDKIFDKPIYNYTRDFPFTLEEIMVPVRYADDYRRVEHMLLEATRRHTESIMREAAASLDGMREKYFLSEPPSVEPRVYVRLTDNWTELSLRFISRAHHARELKDAISRDVLDLLNTAHIGIASGTYAVVEVPPLRVQMTGDRPRESKAEQG
jgi:small-conductance mechanosensitive channel